ncbi:MAG: phosphatidylglycerol lysyltransferase domain-containing protein [Desulfovibrionales bacterium]|nr:phosphatidylglycerol lysyltransferase domain-containing protein [Desulfovibrionales bacterium]
MTELNFEPISFARKDEYMERIALSNTKSSDFSFTNIWGWADEYGLEWAWTKNLVWIRQASPKVRYWAPIGNWDAVDWAKCPYMKQGRTFHRVPERLWDIWAEKLGGRVTAHEDRGQWDYIYNVEELAALKGKKFHKKKNLVNQFKKNYTYTYEPMTADCVEAVLEMQEEWCMWRECEESQSLLAENDAICRVLEHWDVIPSLIGGSIQSEGKVIAYTVAEAINDDTVVIHFEKGKTAYKGIYQAINAFFLQDQGARFVYVNREQDLDDEGLRKSKLSYNPVDFVKKFVVELTEE